MTVPIWEAHPDDLGTALAGPDPIVVLPCADAAWVEKVLAVWAARRSHAPTRVEVLDPAGRPSRGFPGRLSHGDGPVDAKVWIADRAGEEHIGGSADVVWLIDPGATLHDPGALATLRRFAEALVAGRSATRVLLTGHDVRLPPSLAHVGRVTYLSRPSRRRTAHLDAPDIGAWVRAVFVGSPVTPDPREVEAACERVQGLEAHMAARVLLRAAARAEARRLRGDAADLTRAVREERDALLKDGVLEVREVNADIANEVGGLTHLRVWLEEVAALVQDQRDGVASAAALVPRGVLLAGLPGCGKSLCAELAAATLAMPLLQLHMGRLMGRYLGESEGNLLAALEQARASAPCVLWIDEIEKAVGGLQSGGEGGGTGSRMLGGLLSWMQDNDHGVFIFATANELDGVPVELLRRGRLDEHFRVDLPTAVEARDILKKRVEKLGWSVPSAVLDTLTAKAGPLFKSGTPSFSGADLDALVRDAARDAWLRMPNRTELTAANFTHVLDAGFKPQAAQWKERFSKMRQRLEDLNFRPASTLDGSAAGGSAPRSRRDAAREEALPQLTRLVAFGTGEISLEWWSGAERRTVQVSTRDGRRRAVEQMEDRSIEYTVHARDDGLAFNGPDGTVLRLVHRDGLLHSDSGAPVRVPEDRGPPVMILRFDTGIIIELCLRPATGQGALIFGKNKISLASTFSRSEQTKAMTSYTLGSFANVVGYEVPVKIIATVLGDSKTAHIALTYIGRGGMSAMAIVDDRTTMVGVFP
jgi:SpoVK/Ycf46/Vps4 family AAA+-type ATPase